MAGKTPNTIKTNGKHISDVFNNVLTVDEYVDRCFAFVNGQLDISLRRMLCMNM